MDWLHDRETRHPIGGQKIHIAALEAVVDGSVAAVIVEPVQGVAGAIDLGAAFLAALRARCSETCALLVCDEVQCGMGRTGFPFAANMHGIAPDMITTAKALGAGFPPALAASSRCD